MGALADVWHAELRSSPAIEYFKASEASHLKGQFDHKRWDEALRDAKVGKLAAIINHFQPVSFEFSLNRQVFEDELKPGFPYGLGRPHFTMCFSVVAGLAQFAAQQGMTDPTQFILDEQQGVDDDVELSSLS